MIRQQQSPNGCIAYEERLEEIFLSRPGIRKEQIDLLWFEIEIFVCGAFGRVPPHTLGRLDQVLVAGSHERTLGEAHVTSKTVS